MGQKEGPKKNYWMVFNETDNIDYIEKEIAKTSIDLNMDILEMRAWIFKAFVYDPEVKAKVIEFIKKNGSRTNQ
jgi:hypothetical protein